MANVGPPSEKDLSRNCSEAESYEKGRDISDRHFLPNACQQRPFELRYREQLHLSIFGGTFHWLCLDRRAIQSDFVDVCIRQPNSRVKGDLCELREMKRY